MDDSDEEIDLDTLLALHDGESTHDTGPTEARGAPARNTPLRRSVLDIFRGIPSAAITPGSLPPRTQDPDSEPRTSPPTAVPRRPATAVMLPRQAPPTDAVACRSVVDIFRGTPPTTHGSSYNGPLTIDDDTSPWPSHGSTRQLAATRHAPRLVPSEAGGLADACSHVGCNAEIWACCVVRGCSRPLCARHIDDSRCHEHGAAPLTCPCPSCPTTRRVPPRRPFPSPAEQQAEATRRRLADQRKRLAGTDRHRGETVRPRTAQRDGTCLIRALRALGPPVPLIGSGPFWALADGNAILAPFGMHLVPIGGHPLPPGASLSCASEKLIAPRKPPAGCRLVPPRYAGAQADAGAHMVSDGLPSHHACMHSPC